MTDLVVATQKNQQGRQNEVSLRSNFVIYSLEVKNIGSSIKQV